MDMTDNTSYGAVAQYKRAFTNSELEAQLNWHNVKHEMGFFSAEKPGKMPMKPDAEDIRTQLKWRLALDNNSQLLLAQEYHHMKLDDWWPAVCKVFNANVIYHIRSYRLLARYYC